LKGKSLCKKDLFDEFQLKKDLLSRPLIGMVSRLDYQKGIDLVLGAMDMLMEMDIAMVILGDGDQRYVEALEALRVRYPGRLAVRIGRDDRLAHKIIAGSDMILIPSLFEPCGLTQMYALRYGTIPVARATGGLRDTVVPFDPQRGIGNGILFEHPDIYGLVWATKLAIQLFESREKWNELIMNAFKSDFSWDTSAGYYLELYNKLWEKEF
jgi:starch synthase